jgi:hypothetical protein
MIPISPELSRLLSAIRKLTRAERRIIVNQIRRQDGAIPEELPSHAADWLLPGLEYELRARGILLTRLNSERLRALAPNYARDSAPVRAALKAKLGGKPTHAELLAFGRLVASALADYVNAAARGGVPFGPAALFRAVPEAGAALEAAFPGYLAAGLMTRLVRV